METSQTNAQAYLQLFLDAYYEAVDFPHAKKFDRQKHEELLHSIREFVENWKNAELPREEMNRAFRNKIVRETIAAGIPLSMADVEKLHEDWDELCGRTQSRPRL